MRAAAAWIARQGVPGRTRRGGWTYGFVVSERGAVLLLALGILAWLTARRQGAGRIAVAVPVLGEHLPRRARHRLVGDVGEAVI